MGGAQATTTKAPTMPRINDQWHHKDRTRSKAYGTGLRWQSCWTENGKERRKSFATKTAAEDHQVAVGHRQRVGGYIDPTAGRVFIRDILPDWEATLIHLAPSTRAAVQSDLHASIAPYWGDRILADVRRTDVQQWATTMEKAPRTVQTIHGRLLTFLTWCVDEGRITTNPAARVNLPQGRRREHRFLNPQQIHALADAIGEHYRDLVLLLASTGLRIGEAAELRVKDLNLERGRLTVNRAVVFVRGNPMIGPPKSGHARSVPVTPTVAAALAARTATLGPDDLVFPTPRGRQLRASNFKRRTFNEAVARANEDGAGIPADLWVHDLRHTAASLAVASGASVKSIQRMLGHATAAITLDVYAGLFDQELDDVADRMENLLQGS